MADVRIVPAGDAALLVEFPARIDPVINRRAVAMAESLRDRQLAFVRDIVVGYASVTVYFDPLHTDAMLDNLGERARARWGELGHAGDTIELALEGAEFEFTGSGPLVQAGSDGRSPAGTTAAAELSTRG